MEPLLSTKLYIPSVQPNQISRSRLIQQLDEGLARIPGVTLVAAPAGFGKTTLVSRWLEQTGLPAAWLSLDEDDHDFSRFWKYFIAAWQTLQPHIGSQALDLLHSSSQPHPHTLLTFLINDLAALSQNSIMVLDDYHAIQSKNVDEALTFLIDHLPPRIHLVIITRADPDLPLARLRVKGQLNELRGADLSFTQAETAQFLEQAVNLHLSEAEAAAFNERLDGWAAGLQMAAIALEQSDPVAATQFIENFSGSHRYVMDYLIDEVLQKQPAEVQTFLLYTSILDRFSAPLCEALLRETEQNDGEAGSLTSSVNEIFWYLERSSLFICSLDDQRCWYRYHHLFADLLRYRLGQTYPDRVDTLHLRASHWYEEEGLIEPALRHALAASDYSRAATLVERIAPRMIQYGELARMLTWLDTLPEEEIYARPLLALYFDWSLLLSGKIRQAAAHLDHLKKRLGENKTDQSLEVQGHIAALDAYLVRETGDLRSTIALSRQALTYLPEQDALLRAMVSLNLAIAHYLQGDFDPASILLTEIIRTGQTAHLMANTLSAVYLKAQLLRSQGSLQQALELCRETLDLVTQRGWHNFPAAGFLYVIYGELLREQNQLTTAAKALEMGIHLGNEGGHPHISIIGYTWQSRLLQNQGDLAGSHESIRTALQVVREHQVGSFWPLPPAASYQARLWIAQGDLAAASRWASGLDHADVSISFIDETQNLTLARLWIAQHKLEAVDALLDRLHESAKEAGHAGSLIEILTLRAVAFSVRNRGIDALSALEGAMELAEPEGFVRIFLDEGPPMIELLRRAVAQGIHVSYALHLLEASGADTQASQALIEPLSERELEVLRWIAAGYSNQEIAQELVVAVSTVKKHINNIYRKLGVGSRTRAVAQARELGLL